VYCVASQWARAWNIAAGLISSAADQALDGQERHADGLARGHADALWERAYRDLNSHFLRLGNLVQRQINVGFGCGGSYGESPAHPLSCHVSFRKDARGPAPATPFITEDVLMAAFEHMVHMAGAEPEVMLRVDFEEADGAIRYSSGIWRGTRAVTEGPSGVMEAPSGIIGCYGQIKAVLRDIGTFIEDSAPAIADQFRDHPDSR
jgi:hypothetical protein